MGIGFTTLPRQHPRDIAFYLYTTENTTKMIIYLLVGLKVDITSYVFRI